MSYVEPLNEKEWQARDDAFALARAEEIKIDGVRLKAAKEAAKKIAEEREKETIAINRVAQDKRSLKQKETAQKSPANNGNRINSQDDNANKVVPSDFNVFRRI